jgi:N-acetylglucosaminyldiphosphoundecaprenol N-acetyl-beta-D-mannosaminyltransferase
MQTDVKTNAAVCEPAEAHFRVLGVPVNAIQIPGAVEWMQERISQRKYCTFIAVTGMHGIVEAQHDPSFKQVLSSAGLVVPDGMPLVWIGRRQGNQLKRRVYGPELMQTFCEHTRARYRHFFYGGVPGVAVALADSFRRKYDIGIAGCYSPPFGKIAKEEDDEVIALINRANADVLWVGLSTPKQERWMYGHHNSLDAPVLVGVGAAFDLAVGRVKQAPAWMREHGLEWSFRLWQEPRRLWRRYLIYGSEFLLRVAWNECCRKANSDKRKG